MLLTAASVCFIEQDRQSYNPSKLYTQHV